MLRSCLILLLLAHYLLVVGAGLVGRPEPIRQHAVDYVHSTDCQQQHYLRLDCFDRCNGEQYAPQNLNQHQSLPQLLSSLKSLDLHCLSAMPALARQLVVAPSKKTAAELVMLLPTGSRSPLYAPPRRG